MKLKTLLAGACVLALATFVACKKDVLQETDMNQVSSTYKNGPLDQILGELYDHGYPKTIAGLRRNTNSNIVRLHELTGQAIVDYNVRVNGVSGVWYQYGYPTVAVAKNGDIYVCAKEPGSSVFSIFKGNDLVLELPQWDGVGALRELIARGTGDLNLTKLYDITHPDDEGYTVYGIEIFNNKIYAIINDHSGVSYNRYIAELPMSGSQSSYDITTVVSSVGGSQSAVESLSLATTNNSLWLTSITEGKIYQINVNNGTIGTVINSSVYAQSIGTYDYYASCGNPLNDFANLVHSKVGAKTLFRVYNRTANSNVVNNTATAENLVYEMGYNFIEFNSHVPGF